MALTKAKMIELLQHGDFDDIIGAAAILTKLKTVDGPGSELDADKLDGLHATDFGILQKKQGYATTFEHTFDPNSFSVVFMGAGSANRYGIYLISTDSTLAQTPQAMGTAPTNITSVVVSGLKITWTGTSNFRAVAMRLV